MDFQEVPPGARAPGRASPVVLSATTERSWPTDALTVTTASGATPVVPLLGSSTRPADTSDFSCWTARASAAC